MRIALCSLLFLCSCIVANGQMLFVKNALPGAGDTLYYFKDALPMLSPFESEGDGLNWNFSDLQSPYMDYAVFETADRGKYHYFFPNADLVSIHSDKRQELYYYEEGDELFLLGGWGLNINEVFYNCRYHLAGNDKVAFSRKKAYLDNKSIQYRLRIHIAISDTRHHWPVENQNDTLLIELQVEEKENINGWGETRFPGGYEDVVKSSVDQFIEQKNTLLTNDGPMEIGTLESLQFPPYRQRFYFWAEGFMLPVVTLLADDPPIINEATYAATKITQRRQNFNPNVPYIFAYPNPAQGSVRFDIYDLDPGKYTLEIFDILGNRQLVEPINYQHETVVRLGLNQLVKGTYIYSIFNSHGKKLVTRRLVVLNP